MYFTLFILNYLFQLVLCHFKIWIFQFSVLSIHLKKQNSKIWFSQKWTLKSLTHQSLPGSSFCISPIKTSLNTCPWQPGPASSVEDRSLCKVLSRQTAVRISPYAKVSFMCELICNYMHDPDSSKNFDGSRNLVICPTEQLFTLNLWVKGNIAQEIGPMKRVLSWFLVGHSHTSYILLCNTTTTNKQH